MEILFLGVGEACDSNHGNSSVLITTENSTILLDCGFSVPHRFFGVCNDADCLDFIWISHFHGDHFFGLPLLLLRFWQMKRTRPLLLIGQQDLALKTATALELAYPGFADKLSFPLQFHTIKAATPLHCKDLTLQVTPTIHSQCNYGLLLDDGKHHLYYSGDGRPTPEVSQLARNCDLALHEAFTLKNSMHSHGSVCGCLQLMEEAQIKQLALIHLERKTRQNQRDAIDKLLQNHPGVFLPTEGDTIILE
jgi:ribonuclease BN (tRNA processing enzyme)